jgi:hypothetical protein
MAVELACALSACAMTGVIWFVQVVHYPLFAAVGESGWPTYHAGHTRRTGYVVAPLMVVELASAALLATRGGPLEVAGLTLAAVTWVCTFALAVPDHGRLERRFDPGVARRLVTLGWLRCAAWTGHAGVGLAILAQSS